MQTMKVIPSILKRHDEPKGALTCTPCNTSRFQNKDRCRSVTFSPSIYRHENSIKAKQQRLLLLHHASNCSDPSCSLTQHCTKMKLLWKHMVTCRSKSCTLQYCRTSRSILTHHVSCKNQRCKVCLPVRQRLR